MDMRFAFMKTSRLNAPRDRLADDAIMAAANINFINGSYDEADHLYGQIRSDYPRASICISRTFLARNASTKLYQGDEYDDKPLLEAGDLIDQILSELPRGIRARRTATCDPPRVKSFIVARFVTGTLLSTTRR